MPLFDPNNPMSAEAGALWHLADLIAECEAAQALVEATGTDEEKKAKTRRKVVVGTHAPPWDGNQYTVDELAATFCEFILFPDREADGVAAASAFDRADEGGEFVLTVRRYVRDNEVRVHAADDEAGQTASDLSDVFLFFLDRTSALRQQVLVGAENRACPRLNTMIRRGSPEFNEKDKASMQGQYIHATFSITWGDRLE